VDLGVFGGGIVTNLSALMSRFLARRKQARLLRAVEHSTVHYSGGDGVSEDHPVVILGAEMDMVGTMAEWAWLIRKYGTMYFDWHLVTQATGIRGERKIDTVVLRLNSGEKPTHYFDVTESFGKRPDLTR
jgi:hypothetical protein